MEIAKGNQPEMENILSEMRSILNGINKGINSEWKKGWNALSRGWESQGHSIRMARDKMPGL